MRRHMLIVLAVVAAVGLAAAAQAQESATLLLRSGERLTGELVDMGGSGFTMRVGGVDRVIPVSEVTIIDFGGAASALPRAEAARFADSQHLLVLRSGEALVGSLYDIGGTHPLRITFTAANASRNYSSSEVQRIYLAAAPAAALAGGSDEVALAITDPDPTGGKTIEVTATGGWVRTGVVFRKGQAVPMTTRGRVRLSENPDDISGPAGREGRYASGAPLPGAPLGALIGRIGNGQAFGIGDQSSFPAPAAGELWLTVNDDHWPDNAGSYRVTIFTTRIR